VQHKVILLNQNTVIRHWALSRIVHQFWNWSVNYSYLLSSVVKFIKCNRFKLGNVSFETFQCPQLTFLLIFFVSCHFRNDDVKLDHVLGHSEPTKQWLGWVCSACIAQMMDGVIQIQDIRIRIPNFRKLYLVLHSKLCSKILSKQCCSSK